MSLIGKLGLFVGGVAFGSAGFKLLSSRDAKKAYTQVTAAALRCKESVMQTVEKVQEGCSDILADAKEINEKRTEETAAEAIEDAAEAVIEEAPEAPEA